MTDVNSGKWTAPESPISIDYSLDVMEEIRMLATEGFNRLARGGLEIGGVLFGTHQDNLVNVLAMRPVECTYARGPAFVFSEADWERFAQATEWHQHDAKLRGMVPVGWYVSHTRSQILLTEFDKEVYDRFFPEPWHITLVLRPGRMGATRAGFFVRSADGSLRTESSALEFNLEATRLTRALPALAAAGAAPGIESAPLVRNAQTLAPLRREPAQAPAIYEAPRFLSEPAPRQHRWRWLIAWAAAVLMCAFAVRAYVMHSAPEAVALQVFEQQGETRIHWNPAAPAIADARSATLEINDNNVIRKVALDRERLTTGAFPFLRKGTDIGVRLVLAENDGGQVIEVARYLGQPVLKATAENPVEVDDRKRLRDENARLKQDLLAERALVLQLEKRVSTLDNLLRIERNRSEVLGR